MMSNKQLEDYKQSLIKKWVGGFVIGLVFGVLVGWVSTLSYWYSIINY